MHMASRTPARSRRAASPKDPAPRPWKRADLARLPDDGNRYEVLDGALLVTPKASQPHQLVAVELMILLERYVRPSRAAYVVGPGAVPFGENELQPDVQVIPGPRESSTWDFVPAPILVVEVLSTSTRRRDFGIKLDAFLGRVRVPTVWIVDRWAHGACLRARRRIAGRAQHTRVARPRRERAGRREFDSAGSEMVTHGDSPRAIVGRHDSPERRQSHRKPREGARISAFVQSPPRPKQGAHLRRGWLLAR